MPHRQVLLETIRKQEEELKEYQDLLSKIKPLPETPIDTKNPYQNFIEKRRSILALELPFQTGTVSVHKARISAMVTRPSSEAALLQMCAEHCFPFPSSSSSKDYDN